MMKQDLLVPGGGVEPPRALGPADFESVDGVPPCSLQFPEFTSCAGFSHRVLPGVFRFHPLLRGVWREIGGNFGVK